MAVQAWTLEQLSKLRRYQPEMVDHALEEMLERQADLRWSVVIGERILGSSLLLTLANHDERGCSHHSTIS